ncbi:ABC transporter permease [Candidatus Saganbacteria bacterium]|uniref:Transport permease protein n=1 Tax=Candidatus Saganbacteria bacterium TaxID=2575572 RepID=A0A9D6UMS3_UNCSA|nr:ABC transporter permease [Candidatus Saganbacteria bacterium]
MSLSYRVYYVWKRNFYSFKRFVIPTLLVSLGEPLFYLVAMGMGLGAYMGLLGGKSYLGFLAPGIVMSGVMLSSAFECLYGTLVRMIHEKIFDSLIVTPISAEDAVAGDIAWAIFRGWISGFLVLAAAVLLGAVSVSLPGVILLFLAMTAVGLVFASLSMIVTSFAPNFDFFNYYTELFITPMFFFSGVFFPLDRLPEWVKVAAHFLPLTHAVDISRAALEGRFSTALAYNFLALILPGIILFYAALLCMKRRLIK